MLADCPMLAIVIAVAVLLAVALSVACCAAEACEVEADAQANWADLLLVAPESIVVATDKRCGGCWLAPWMSTTRTRLNLWHSGELQLCGELMTTMKAMRMMILITRLRSIVARLGVD